MLQKFTQKTTFYYKQFNDLGNLYYKKGQNGPQQIHQVKPYLHQNETDKKAKDTIIYRHKKTRRSGFLFWFK